MHLKNKAGIYVMASHDSGIMIVGNPCVTVPEIDRALKEDLTQLLNRKGHAFIDTSKNRHNIAKNVRTYALFSDHVPYAELALNELGFASFSGQRLNGNTPQGRGFVDVPKLGLFANPVQGKEYDLSKLRDVLYDHLTR